MKYQVPQFIEVESKIFGPLTLKQFIYLVGGAGTLFLLYIVLPIWLVFLIGLPIALLAVALAFYKINNQPFIIVLENGFKYLVSSRLYLWKKTPQKLEPQKPAGQSPLGGAPPFVPRLTQSKLKDLAWSLDVQSKIK